MKRGRLIFGIMLVFVLLSVGVADARNFVVHNSSDSDQSYFFVDGDLGRVGVGVATPLHVLDVNGTANFTGEIYLNGTALSSLIGASGLFGNTDGLNVINNETALGLNLTGNITLWDGARLAVGQNAGFNGSSYGVSIGGANVEFFPEDNSLGSYGFEWTTEHPFHDVQAYIKANRTAVSNAPTDLVFATASSPGNPTEKLRIKDDGNVGIGTSSPNFALDVFGVVNASHFETGDSGNVFYATTYRRSGAANTVSDIYSEDDDGLVLGSAGGDNTLVLGSNERVGIGVSAPLHTLDINGTTNITGDLYINGTAVSQFLYNQSSSSGTSNIFNQDLNITSNVTFDNATLTGDLSVVNGRVGIGVVDTMALLSLRDGISTNLTLGTSTNNQGNHQIGFSFFTGGSTPATIAAVATGAGSKGNIEIRVTDTAGDGANANATDRNVQFSATENNFYKDSIFNGNNLTISNPVSGQSGTRALRFDHGAGSNEMKVAIASVSTSLNNGGDLRFVVRNDSTGGGGIYDVTDPSQVAQIITSSGLIGFHDITPDSAFDVNTNVSLNDTLYVVDGKVGIGTSAPGEKLAVNGGIDLADNNYLTWDTSNTRLIGNSDYLQFQVASADVVRFASGGDVGIGTNSPSNKLDIRGDLNVSGDIYYANGTLVSAGGGATTNLFDQDLNQTNNVSFHNLSLSGDLRVGSTFYVNASNGWVGVGGTAFDVPDNKFHIDGEGSNQVLKLESNSGAYVGLYDDDLSLGLFGDGQGLFNDAFANSMGFRADQGYLHFGANGLDDSALTLNSTGYLGINTKFPGHYLDVNGTVNITGDLYINGTAVFGNLGGGGSGEDNLWKSTTTTLYNDTAGVKVGIGTSTPNATLHTSGDGPLFDLAGSANNFHYLTIIDGDQGADVVDWRPYVGTTTAALRIQSLQDNNILLVPTTTNATEFINTGNLTVYTGARVGATKGTAALHINREDQKVGIGTTTPAYKLNVVNDAVAHVGVSAYYDDVVVENDAAATGVGITLLGKESGGFAGYKFGDASDGNEGGIVYDFSNNVLIFETNSGTEQLRIDSSGRVGIGTSSPSNTLDVRGDLNISGDIYYSNGTLVAAGGGGGGLFENVDGVNVINNLTASALNISGNFTIPNIGRIGIGTETPASTLNIVDNTDDFRAYSNAQGDFRIGLWQERNLSLITNGARRVTILGDGKVGIGTASPDSILDVHGNVTVQNSSIVFDSDDPGIQVHKNESRCIIIQGLTSSLEIC